jgi:hypothetical protein
MRQYRLTLGKMIAEGVLLALGRRTGAWPGFAEPGEVGRKCFGQIFSMRSRSRTNWGRTTWAPKLDDETSKELYY